MTILLGCAGRRQVHERDGRFLLLFLIIIAGRTREEFGIAVAIVVVV
jgi:hypothetical protein